MGDKGGGGGRRLERRGAAALLSTHAHVPSLALMSLHLHHARGTGATASLSTRTHATPSCPETVRPRTTGNKCRCQTLSPSTHPPTFPLTEKVAYTAITLEPEIVICKYPSRSEVARLKNPAKGTKVEYVSLAFTRDGKRLVSCGSLPSFEILIWDLEKQTVVASTNVKNDCSMCAFNPMDNNQFYVGGEHGLWFCNLRKEYDNSILDKVHAQLGDEDTEGEDTEGDALEDEEQMSDYVTAASWTTDQLLLVANAMGEFMQVSLGDRWQWESE